MERKVGGKVVQYFKLVVPICFQSCPSSELVVFSDYVLCYLFVPPLNCDKINNRFFSGSLFKMKSQFDFTTWSQILHVAVSGGNYLYKTEHKFLNGLF